MTADIPNRNGYLDQVAQGYAVVDNDSTLASRHSSIHRADLIEVFKMVKGLSSDHWSLFFHRANDSTTRGHSWKLMKKNCCTGTRLCFFSQRVINRWNSLTQEDVDAASINSFKNKLDKKRTCQMDFLKDKQSTSPTGCMIRGVVAKFW